jgi:hypothetical protein
MYSSWTSSTDTMAMMRLQKSSEMLDAGIAQRLIFCSGVRVFLQVPSRARSLGHWTVIPFSLLIVFGGNSTFDN